MDGKTRISLNYHERLYKFHRQQNTKIRYLPILNKRPINLYELRAEIKDRGGCFKASLTWWVKG
jgi:histone demethylase JARID1